MKTQTLIQGIKWIALSICTIAVLLFGTTQEIRAINTDVKYDVRVVASDNIKRLSTGKEVSGYLYGLSAGLEFNEYEEGEHYVFGAMGGKETVSYEVGDDFTVNTYRLYADINEDLANGYFLRLSGSATRDVDYLGFSDLDQRRTLQDRIIAEGEYGRKLANGSQWMGSIYGRYLEFSSEAQIIAGFTGYGDLLIDRRTTLHGDGYYQSGMEQNSQDEWGEGEITVGLSKKQSPSFLLGGEVTWYKSQSYFTQIDSTMDWDHIKLAASQESMVARSTKLTAELGYEGLKTNDVGWDWGGTMGASFYAPLNHDITTLGKVAEVASNFYYGVDISRLNNRSPILNNLLQFDAEITWRPGRRSELNTGFRIARKTFLGQFSQEEKQSYANVRFRWLATKYTNLLLEAIYDQRDSELDSLDLEEKRVEMKISGSF